MGQFYFDNSNNFKISRANQKIIKDAPWQVVWFSIGFYIVVYGPKNAGLTDYLTVILKI